MKKIVHQLQKVLASTEEINFGFNTHLKEIINKSHTSCVVIGEENISGLKPVNGDAFYANICEPECWKGKYYICKDPVYNTMIDPNDKNFWKITYCRQICDRHRKSGICRRALIKIAFV
jgi:hypothetical protein